MKIQMWPIEKVVPYEQNIKKHPKEQIDKIVASIKATGWDQPIVVDRKGVIIKGHGRRLAAIAMGLKEVPVLCRDDLTDEQARAARLNDNRAAISDLDTEMLRLELSEINLELLSGVFDEKELEFSMADLGVMNEGAFINDLDAAVEAQQAETAGKAEAMKAVRIPLKKAFGFDSVEGKDEIYVSRFMAEVELQSGLKGEAAFMAFIRKLVGEVTQS